MHKHVHLTEKNASIWDFPNMNNSHRLLISYLILRMLHFMHEEDESQQIKNLVESHI